MAEQEEEKKYAKAAFSFAMFLFYLCSFDSCKI